MITDSGSKQPGLYLVALAGLMLLHGCGGDSTSGLDKRINAAARTASNNAACTSITPFYWEIGNAEGVLASGAGGDNSSAPPGQATVMPIASGSKWVFAAYVLEKQAVSAGNPLSATDIQYLNFTSGYHSFSSLTCALTTTVQGCFDATNGSGGHNSDQTSADIGHFFYSGGHFEAYAVNVLGLGPDNDADITSEVTNYIGQDVALTYSSPDFAGGIRMTPGMYGVFLRHILNGDLRMRDYLDADAVCTHTHATDCNALYSPVNESDASASTNDVSDEAWHYSLGHWIEDDPAVGDGAYSSPGLYGFYPWIDHSKTWYGMLARYDSSALNPPDPTRPPAITSVNCGRLIRQAWETATAQ